MIWIACYLLNIGSISPSPIAAQPLLTPNIASMPGDIRIEFDKLLREVPQEHFFPAANMRKLLDKYSAEELSLIYKDFCEIRELTFAKADKKSDYIVTAGGPAAGKSTALELLIEGGECPEKSLDTKIARAYIDPDRSCLLRMKHTYQADLFSALRTPQEAYEHWREASNFLSNFYLAVALKEGYAIAHGSTMATPLAKTVLSSIKHTYGYRTTILHMTCEEPIRKASDQLRRHRGVFQCTEKDFVEKQAIFFSLLADYIAFSDRVLFCYRGSVDRFVWAAHVENNTLEIYDETAFVKIRQAHDAAQGDGFFKDNFAGGAQLHFSSPPQQSSL